MQHRSAENEKVEYKMVIFFEATLGVKNRSEGVYRSAEQKAYKQLQPVRIVFVNGDKKENAQPAQQHIKHHLQSVVFFLVDEGQRNSGHGGDNTHADTRNRKPFAIWQNIEYHQRNTCSRYQNKNYRMVNKSSKFFRIAGRKPMVN